MKNFKKLALSFVLLLALTLNVSSVNAAEVGVVNVKKLLTQYTKAQDYSTDLKIKEAELQTFLADAQKKLKNAKSPLEKKNVEEQLTKEYMAKKEAYSKEQIAKWNEIDTDVTSTIKEVSERQALDVVLNKNSVLQGGVDITDKVLSILNNKAKK